MYVDAAYYQSLIGILQWMVELGRIDIICVKVSMVSSCLALLLEGHLKQLFHIHNAVRLKTRLDGMASGRSRSLVTSNLKKKKPHLFRAGQPFYYFFYNKKRQKMHNSTI